MPLVSLVPLEPFESLELLGDLSVLELVFLRRSSLKNGIVTCRSLTNYSKRTFVFDRLQMTSESGEEYVVELAIVKENLPGKLMPITAGRC